MESLSGKWRSTGAVESHNNQLPTMREGWDITFSEAAKFNFLPLVGLVMPC